VHPRSLHQTDMLGFVPRDGSCIQWLQVDTFRLCTKTGLVNVPETLEITMIPEGVLASLVC